MLTSAEIIKLASKGLTLKHIAAVVAILESRDTTRHHATPVVSNDDTAVTRSRNAEKCRAYRERRQQSSTSDTGATPERHHCDTNTTPPPSPQVSFPQTPNLPPPTPMPVHGGAREDGELFGGAEPEKSVSAAKRVKWSESTGWTGFTAEDMTYFREAGPALDINRQLSASDLWLRANPAKARKKNFYRFFVNWIERQQERGGDRSGNTSLPSQPKPALQPFKMMEEEARKKARFGPEDLHVVPFRLTPEEMEEALRETNPSTP